MTAERYLRQYKHAWDVIRRCEEELEQERMLIDTVRSPSDNDGMPHGSGISKPTEEKALRLADKAASWKEAELDAIHARQEVFELINSIDGIEGEVLYERYVKLHKWEEICILLRYSWQGIHKVHKRALGIVESRLK